MIPRFFVSVDSSRACERAREWANKFAAAVVVDGAMTVPMLKALPWAAGSVFVLNFDGASPEARKHAVSLSRSGQVVGYGTSVPKGLSGVTVALEGLSSDIEVYLACVESGLTPEESALATRYGRGSVERGVKVFDVLARRVRVLRMLEAVRDRSWGDAMDRASEFTSSDIGMLRLAVNEIEQGEFVVWQERDVEILARNIAYVRHTVPDFFVSVPAITAMALAAGLFAAESGVAL